MAGAPYYRLHKPRASFDEVTTMAVEGVGISATARIKKRRKDRVVKVERKRIVGNQAQLKEALLRSEDSSDPDSRHPGWNRFEEAEFQGHLHQLGVSLFMPDHLDNRIA